MHQSPPMETNDNDDSSSGGTDTGEVVHIPEYPRNELKKSKKDGLDVEERTKIVCVYVIALANAGGCLNATSCSHPKFTECTCLTAHIFECGLPLAMRIARAMMDWFNLKKTDKMERLTGWMGYAPLLMEQEAAQRAQLSFMLIKKGHPSDADLVTDFGKGFDQPPPFQEDHMPINLDEAVGHIVSVVVSQSNKDTSPCYDSDNDDNDDDNDNDEDETDNDNINSSLDEAAATEEMLAGEKQIKEAQQHVKYAQRQRALFNQKEKEAKKDHKNGIPHCSQRYVVLVADYCQNMGLPHFGSKQPGET